MLATPIAMSRHMRLFHVFLLSALMSPVGLAHAQDIGRLAPEGKPIVPAEEGRLVRLVKAADATLPAYRVVHAGGEPVLIMDESGRILTPQEAWAEWGGETAPISTPKRSLKGSFSVPNARP